MLQWFHMNIFIFIFWGWIHNKIHALMTSDKNQTAYIGGWITSATSLRCEDGAGIHAKPQSAKEMLLRKQNDKFVGVEWKNKRTIQF